MLNLDKQRAAVFLTFVFRQWSLLDICSRCRHKENNLSHEPLQFRPKFCFFVWNSDFVSYHLCMADPNALPQAPGARRRIKRKRPPRNEDSQNGVWRQEPDLDLQTWRTIRQAEQDEMIDFLKHETTFGSLKPRTKWDLQAINYQRKIANTAPTRSWKKACENNMARFGDKVWELSGLGDDSLEYAVYTKRYFYFSARHEIAIPAKRTALCQCLILYVCPSDRSQNPLVTQELQKNAPTLLNFNGAWGSIPNGSISNFEDLEGPDAVAEALRIQGSSQVRDLRLEVTRVIQSVLAKDPRLEWAWCIEISTTTLEEVVAGTKDMVRIHLHILVHPSVGGLLYGMFDILGTHGVIGRKAMQRLGVKVSRAWGKAYAPAFYVLVDKIGQVESCST